MKNIVLTGFMGSGKSSVGKLVAKDLNYTFYDMDTVICERAGKTVQQIFDQFGEEYFRDLESEVARDLAKTKLSVIACGGGTVLRPSNIDCLRENGIIFFLDTPIHVIEDRMVLLAGRPLLVGATPIQLRKIFEKRKEFYENNDFSIHTENKKISAVAAEISEIYKAQTGIAVQK